MTAVIASDDMTEPKAVPHRIIGIVPLHMGAKAHWAKINSLPCTFRRIHTKAAAASAAILLLGTMVLVVRECSDSLRYAENLVSPKCL
jgi:hypothetical protein